MRQSLIIIFFISSSLNLFAHKDRIERPKTYIFIFQNNDTVILKSPNDSILKSYTNDIVSHKKILIEAFLTFNTGESLIFKSNGNIWTTIRINVNNKEIEVPSKTLHKISKIHFESVALSWDSFYETASVAKSFYIEFDIGKEKSFGKYPSLQLFFTSKRFIEANIWRQTNERTTQWYEL